jgi:hypothetical protein
VEELIPITMFMCIATVMILRPISTKVGALLEAITRERMQRQAPSATAGDPQLARVTTLLEQLVRRQEQLEERLDFTERLLSGGRRQAKPPVTDSVGVFDDVRLSQETVHGFHR